jgi:hypothetical protein
MSGVTTMLHPSSAAKRSYPHPLSEEEEEEEEVNRLPVAWAEWSGRCWLRVHCRCAALLVLC